MPKDKVPYFQARQYSENSSSTAAASSSQPSYAMNPEYDYLWTVKVIGDAGTGKRSLTRRFCEDSYTEPYQSRWGQEREFKTIDVSSWKVRLGVYFNLCRDKKITNDRKGRPGLGKIYLVTFDFGDRISFDNAKNWLEEIKKEYQRYEPEHKPVVILVGTKVDYRGRYVPQNDIDSFIDEQKDYIDAFFETSSKDGINVEEMFNYAAQLVMKNVNPKYHTVVKREKRELSSKQQLIERLQVYIDRVESHKRFGQTNFQHGFWFFSESRGLNREANYLLAIELRDELKKTDKTQRQSIADIFRGYEERREKIIGSEPTRFSSYNYQYLERGINSSELMGIIRDALEGSEVGSDENQANDTPSIEIRRK